MNKKTGNDVTCDKKLTHSIGSGDVLTAGFVAGFTLGSDTATGTVFLILMVLTPPNLFTCLDSKGSCLLSGLLRDLTECAG